MSTLQSSGGARPRLLVRQGLTLLWDVIVSPSQAGQALDVMGSLTFLLPLCLVWLLHVAFQFVIQSPAEAILVDQMRLHMGDSQLNATLEYLRSSRQIGLFLTPLFILLKWVAVAFLMYLVLVLIDELFSFGTLVSLVGFASLFSALADLEVLLILYIRGFDSLHKLTDLQPSIGLGLLCSSKRGFAYSFAEHFSVFELWGIAFLSVAIYALLRRKSAFRALMPAAGVWLSVALVHSAFVALLPSS
ncbi:MAG: hypothetical protein P8Z74_06520 [Acidobacteriota bacterium]